MGEGARTMTSKRRLSSGRSVMLSIALSIIWQWAMGGGDWHTPGHEEEGGPVPAHHLLVLDARIALGRLAAALEEEAIRELPAGAVKQGQ